MGKAVTPQVWSGLAKAPIARWRHPNAATRHARGQLTPPLISPTVSRPGKRLSMSQRFRLFAWLGPSSAKKATPLLGRRSAARRVSYGMYIVCTQPPAVVWRRNCSSLCEAAAAVRWLGVGARARDGRKGKEGEPHCIFGGHNLAFGTCASL